MPAPGCTCTLAPYKQELAVPELNPATILHVIGGARGFYGLAGLARYLINQASFSILHHSFLNLSNCLNSAE